MIFLPHLCGRKITDHDSPPINVGGKYQIMIFLPHLCGRKIKKEEVDTSEAVATTM